MNRFIPTLIFIISLILIRILYQYFPIIIFFNSNLKNIISSFIMIIGIIILIAGFMVLAENKTTSIPNQKSNKLLTSGIYQFSRNPMYLGLLIVLIGVWIDYNCLNSLVILIGYFCINNFIIIKNEENYLHQQFTNQYLDYQKKVRRWL